MAKDNFGLVCLEFVVWFTRTQVSWFLGQRYFLKARLKSGISLAKKCFANAQAKGLGALSLSTHTLLRIFHPDVPDTAHCALPGVNSPRFA